jgi:hypothetical protein
MARELNPVSEPTSGGEEGAPAVRYDLSGAAASSRINAYRPNTGEVRDRSVEALLAGATSKGVTTPDYLKINPRDPDDPPTTDGRSVGREILRGKRSAAKRAYLLG